MGIASCMVALGLRDQQPVGEKDQVQFLYYGMKNLTGNISVYPLVP